MKWTKNTKKIAKKRGKYKSILENKVSKGLLTSGMSFDYEKNKLPYLTPVERHSYTPDFEDPSGIHIIEAKGRLTIADRKKMLLVREQYPDKIFYLVFGNARERLYKGSPTNYGEWAEKHDFKWCDFYRNGIPKEWFNEV